MPPQLTVRQQAELVIAQVKSGVESDVEFVTYVRLPAQRKMMCMMHMRNSFVFEGFGVLLHGGNEALAREVARRDALRKVILVQQYLLCDELYFDATFRPALLLGREKL